MEPDDLSFIEISGEHDSLLQQIPTDDVSSLNKIYFTCSPLQIPRSACSVNPPPLVSPIDITVNEDAGKLDLSSNRDSVDKENVNSNKPEVPKLSMEPQQMKRKKKGGGYNLRKSLAWDRAFFTDEGVLDPLELSMISGNFGKSSGKMLSVIEEDGRASLGGNSEDLTAFEKNMFSELPASTVSEDKMSNHALLPKIGSSSGVIVASTSVAKRKVISTHDVYRSGSKRSGYPPPIASASLKRPANTKSTTRELKVSKTPVRKLDTSVHSATAKNNIPRPSNVKGNRIAQPAFHVQRNVGLKGSSDSVKSAQSDARSGLAGGSMAVKSSVQQARRNVANSALEIQSSVRSQHPLVSKTNNGLQIDTRPPLPTPGHVSNNRDGDVCNDTISCPSDGSMQHAQPQSTKPSGLRMPSPSLGFFNQSKASASHSLLLRSKQACNPLGSNISNFRKIGTLNAINERPVPAPRKMPDKVTASDMRIPSSKKGSSIPTSLNTNSREKIPEFQMVELNLSSKSNSFSILNYEQNLLIPCYKQSLQNEGPSKNEKISHVADNDLKSSNNKLLLHRELSDQLNNAYNAGVVNIYPMSMDLSGAELENPHFSSHLQSTVQDNFQTKDMTDNQCMEDKMSNSLFKNHAASSESQSGDAICDSITGNVKRQDDWLSSVNHVNEQSRKQAEETMACTNQVLIQNQKPWINNGALYKESKSSEFHNCKNAKTADACPEVGCCSGGAVKNSLGSPYSEDTVEAKECVAGVHNFCTKSQVEDAAVQSVDGILSVGRGAVFLCSSALDKMVVDDVNENVSDANGSELKTSCALCSIPPPMQDCGLDMAETAECPHGDNTISGFTDAQLCLDIETTSGEPEMICKDQQINVVTAAIAEMSSVCSNSGGCSAYELDLQHFETQPSVLELPKNDGEVNGMIAAMHIKNSYAIDEVNAHKCIENKQYSLSVNDECSNSDLQPADDIPQVYNDWLSNRHISCQQYLEGNQILTASEECLSKDSMPPKDSGESITGKVTDVCLGVKGCQRGLESPQDLYLHECIAQRNEVTGFDKTIEKWVVEDTQMQILEGSLFVHGHKSSINATLVDEVHEQSSVHPELLNSDLAAAQGSLDAHGLSLGDKVIINNLSSEEYQAKKFSRNLMDAVLGQSDYCGIESRSSVVHTQVGTAVREAAIDEDLKTDCASNDDNVQNIEVNVLKRDVLSEEASNSLNNDSSNHQIKHKSENLIFATDNSTMSSSGSFFQNVEFNVLKSYVSPADAETTNSQRSGGSNCEMHLELEDTKFPTEDQDATKFLSSGNDKKQDNFVLKPPPHAVPFSDEWLATFEAAGEEILTMKSGAVQNSPPDKSLPEPGPWSPVKRKNNQGIGPFDCTKFTNGNNYIPPSNSSQGD